VIAGTHIAFASALYLAGAALFEYDTDLIGWALAAAASLLPDTDLPTSRLGRALFFLSTRLERRFGHRTITHSLVAVAAVTVLASPLFLVNPLWAWCVVGGYWSHLWIDMLNIRGADLLWPSPIRVVLPGNRNWRMEVGSKAEMVLLIALVVASLALYPVSGLGFRGGLQRLLGNFEMARDSFIEQAGTRWFTLEIEAIDNLTLEHIACDCPVLGTWQNGLIVLHDGRPRAVGKSPVHHNLYPTTTKLLAGEPLRVVAHKVDLRDRSLRWLISSTSTSAILTTCPRDVGREQARPSPRPGPLPAGRFDGKVLQLHYARAQELGPYLNLVAAQGEVYVQVWLKPGDPPVEMAFGEEGREEVIPGVLRTYL
jgi:inner membrane protein